MNAVELMPIFEFDEMESTRVVDGERLYNYWGYNTVCFFAPNTSYTSVVEHNHEGDELKELIRTLTIKYRTVAEENAKKAAEEAQQ